MDRTAALAHILVSGLYAFMIVNSLCKIFVSIFVFKDYRSRVFFVFKILII